MEQNLLKKKWKLEAVIQKDLALIKQPFCPLLPLDFLLLLRSCGQLNLSTCEETEAKIPIT